MIEHDSFNLLVFITDFYEDVQTTDRLTKITAKLISQNYKVQEVLTQFSPCASTGGRRESKPHLHVNLKIYQVLNFM